jgi:drug/metabolite transporter (DMT)-like permease
MRVALAFAAICVFPSTTWIAIKVSLEGASPLVGAGVRFLIAAPCLLLLRAATGGSLNVPRAAWPHVLAVSMLLFAIPYGLIYVGETRISTGLTAVLFGAMPLVVVVAADRARRREPLTAPRIAGVLVGMLGLAVAFHDGLEVAGEVLDVLAMLGVVLAAVASGVGQVRVRARSELVPMSLLVAWGCTVAGAALMLLAVATGESRLAPDLEAVVANLYLGVTAAGGFWAMFWLIGRVGAVYVSLHALVVPVLSLAWAAAFYGEPVTVALAAGGLVVCTGIGIVAADGLRRERQTRT